MWFSSLWSGAERLRAVAIACALLLALPAIAGTTAMLPALVQKYLDDARLAGTGRLTWFGFHVYDASLYVQGGLDPGDPAARPFVLELRYARRLKGAAIADASRDEMQRLGLGSVTQRAAWHSTMTRLFPDVEEGQRLAGVNLPGRGARFYFDGRLLGAVDDPLFARAFFAIWLDERTREPQLREALLRGAVSAPAAGT